MIVFMQSNKFMWQIGCHIEWRVLNVEGCMCFLKKGIHDHVNFEEAKGRIFLWCHDEEINTFRMMKKVIVRTE